MVLNKVMQRYKINEVVNKFLLAGNKFVPEMHLRQPVEHLQKTKKEYKNLAGDSWYIYQNELDKAYFQCVLWRF